MANRLSRYFDGWIADILRQTTPEGLREALFEGAMRRRLMSPGFVDLEIGHFTFAPLRLARRSIGELVGEVGLDVAAHTVVLSTYFDSDWGYDYFGNDASKDDPTIDGALARPGWFFWDGMREPDQAKLNDGFLRESISYGIDHGLTLSAHDPFGNVGLIALCPRGASGSGRFRNLTYAPLLREMQRVMQAAHVRYSQIMKVPLAEFLSVGSGEEGGGIDADLGGILRLLDSKATALITKSTLDPRLVTRELEAIEVAARVGGLAALGPVSARILGGGSAGAVRHQHGAGIVGRSGAAPIRRAVTAALRQGSDREPARSISRQRQGVGLLGLSAVFAATEGYRLREVTKPEPLRSLSENDNLIPSIVPVSHFFNLISEQEGTPLGSEEAKQLDRIGMHDLRKRIRDLLAAGPSVANSWMVLTSRAKARAVIRRCKPSEFAEARQVKWNDFKEHPDKCFRQLNRGATLRVVYAPVVGDDSTVKPRYFVLQKSPLGAKSYRDTLLEEKRRYKREWQQAKRESERLEREAKRERKRQEQEAKRERERQERARRKIEEQEKLQLVRDLPLDELKALISKGK